MKTKIILSISRISIVTLLVLMGGHVSIRHASAQRLYASENRPETALDDIFIFYKDEVKLVFFYDVAANATRSVFPMYLDAAEVYHQQKVKIIAYAIGNPPEVANFLKEAPDWLPHNSIRLRKMGELTSLAKAKGLNVGTATELPYLAVIGRNGRIEGEWHGDTAVEKAINRLRVLGYSPPQKTSGESTGIRFGRLLKSSPTITSAKELDATTDSPNFKGAVPYTEEATNQITAAYKKAGAPVIDTNAAFDLRVQKTYQYNKTVYASVDYSYDATLKEVAHDLQIKSPRLQKHYVTIAGYIVGEVQMMMSECEHQQVDCLRVYPTDIADAIRTIAKTSKFSM